MTADAPDRFRLLPPIAVVFLAWLVLFPIVTVDAHYHLATGRRILEQGEIPSRGVGSATFGQAPWHDNEWGFQVLAAAVSGWERDEAGVWVLTRGGIVRLILLRALCLAATLALLSAQMARSGVGALTRSVALVLAGFLTFGNLFWAIRPQIFSYLGLACVAYLLERDRHGDRRAGWCVLPVIALWANLHGAFVIGIALVGTEAAGETFDAWRRGDAAGRRRAGRLWLLLVLAPAAALLNPHGYHQLLHPFLYMLQPEIYRGNVEWSRPDFSRLPLFVLTTALLAAALAARRGARTADVLRCAAFLFLVLGALRHLPLAVVIVVPVLAAGLAQAARQGGWRRHLEPTGPGWGRPAVRAVAAAMLVATVVALSGAWARPEPRFVALWPRFELRPARTMPDRATRLLARSGVGGSIFNGYRFGGFLMFRLYPEERVFMDGRNDLYGTFRDAVYNRILHTRPGWRPVWKAAVREHDVGAVMIDAANPLAAALREDPGWVAAGEDGAVTDREPGPDEVVLFLRAGRSPGAER